MPAVPPRYGHAPDSAGWDYPIRDGSGRRPGEFSGAPESGDAWTARRLAQAERPTRNAHARHLRRDGRTPGGRFVRLVEPPPSGNPGDRISPAARRFAPMDPQGEFRYGSP